MWHSSQMKCFLYCTQSASIYEGIGERGELVGGVTTPESWPMGTPHLAMALYWPTGWPHWPTGKLVDGGEQARTGPVLEP
jgi:hypothetical protein